MQHLLIKYRNDPDARVRTGAFAALLSMHQRDLPLERSLYEPVCLALSDENEGVYETHVAVFHTENVFVTD